MKGVLRRVDIRRGDLDDSVAFLGAILLHYV
jgi:hypothetical protein